MNLKSISQEMRRSPTMTIMITGTIMALEDTATGTTCLKEKLRLHLLPVSQVSLAGYSEKNYQVNKKELYMVGEGKEKA